MQLRDDMLEGLAIAIAGYFIAYAVIARSRTVRRFLEG